MMMPLSSRPNPHTLLSRPHKILVSRVGNIRFASNQTDSDNSSKTVNVRIKGTVQGVCYRQWTIETARRLGLDGWVRNRRDGTVEAVFSGKPDTVDNMIENCRRGAFYSKGF